MWLLERQIMDAINHAEETGFEPSASQRSDFEALNGEITTLAGSTATIQVTGVLTANRSIMAMIFGGGNTTYTDLIAAVEAADNDSTITNIDLMMDSPGGQIDGLFEAMDVLRKTSTNIRTIVINSATSAAYGLAAQSNEIIALNRASKVGSIGIVTQGRIARDVVTVTSSNAPFKRPDIATETGRAVIREELDAVESLFIQAIAEGRDKPSAMIVADFGKGATFLAGEAMRRGMVDKIGLTSTIDAPPPTPTGSTPQTASGDILTDRVTAMNLTELKAEHPALYEQVYALGQKDGLEAGKDDERKRVNAHLKLGTRFKAMDTAVKAISDGVCTTDPEVNADYMCAMADSRDLIASQDDSDNNDPGDITDPPPSQDGDEEDPRDAEAATNILKFAANNLGLELEGGA